MSGIEIFLIVEYTDYKCSFRYLTQLKREPPSDYSSLFIIISHDYLN